MEEITLKVSNVKKRTAEVLAKIELITTALAVVFSILESLSEYRGIQFLIPISVGIIFLIYLIILILYSKISVKLGSKLDLILQLLIGTSFLISAVNLHLMGGTLRMAIIHFSFGVIILTVVAPLVYKFKDKNCITISNKGIKLRVGFGRTLTLTSETITNIIVNTAYLEIFRTNNKSKKYYFLDNDTIDIKGYLDELNINYKESN